MLKILHSYRHATSIFDDFSHYEKRQAEEDQRKTTAPASSPGGHSNVTDYEERPPPQRERVDRDRDYHRPQSDRRDRDFDRDPRDFRGRNDQRSYDYRVFIRQSFLKNLIYFIN